MIEAILGALAALLGFIIFQNSRKKKDQDVVDDKVDDLHDQQGQTDEEGQRREDEITDRIDDIDEEIQNPDDLTPEEAIRILRERHGWPDPDGDHAP